MHCSHCEREIGDTWMMKAWLKFTDQLCFFHLACYEKNCYWANVANAYHVKSRHVQEISNEWED
jgi:hypothetical protein